MKKLKLKKWVKVVILLLIFLLVIIINYCYTEKDVKRCISNGNTKTWCYSHLG